MEKFLITLALFFCVSVLNANPLIIQQNQLFKKNIPDSIKSADPVRADSTKKSKSDTTNITIREKLIPVKIPSILKNSNYGNLLRKDELDKLDYRNSINYLNYTPFGFVREPGSLGQPTEVLLYGQGYNSISVLNDGISTNNRLTNSYDMNAFQSESIDSIEFIPAVRGFLYGVTNNISAINFIPKDFQTNKPYTRIKFYQAPNEEGIFDGIFSANFSERLSTFVEVTHQSTEPRFKNSDLSLWQASARVRYILSNSLNLIGSYNYARSIVQLFGGVDADTIRVNNTPDQFDKILYDNFLAPVRFNYRYQKASNHMLGLRLLGNFIHNSPSDLSFYYNSGLTEYRQNETDSSKIQKNADIISDNNEYTTYGMRFRQDFSLGIGDLTSITELEQTEIRTPLLIKKKSGTNFSTSAKLTIDLPGSIGQASAFGKYLNYFGESYSGSGADGTLIISNSFSAYLGFSNFQKPSSLFAGEADLYAVNTNEKEKITVTEAKINYKSGLFTVSLGYFNQDFSNKLIATTLKNDTLNNDAAFFFTTKDLTLQGINLLWEMKFWKFRINTNTSFYLSENSRKEFGLPQFTSLGGIYYVDTLFNSNLKLKTGLNYYFLGKRNGLHIDFERSMSTTYSHIISPNIRSFPAVSSEEYSAEFQIDFFLAGTIQDNATLYFIFENLLNNKYFIVPYYPQRERGIRFGVSWEFFD